MTLPYLDELKKSTHLNPHMRVKCLDMRVKENWLRSMGWSNLVYLTSSANSPTRERYNLETVPNMKRMCKQNGIKGCSKLGSRELAKRLMSI
jgi:hypothetical protein